MNLHQSSLHVIRSGQSATGAYVASPSFSQYGYCWLRDGTWIAYGMDCAGQHDSAQAFYRWVCRTLERQRPRVDRLLEKKARGEPYADPDYLPTRFTLDGQVSEDDWGNFQLDGYGTWLWGLVEHVRLTGDEALWIAARPAVELTVRYLDALWPVPNYDCWEEHPDQIHISTLAALYGGLKAVQDRDPSLVPGGLPDAIREYALRVGTAHDGHLVKYLGSDAVDANLLWTALPYRLVEVTDPCFAATLARIERDLHRPGGGVYRYAADVYYGGGEWPLLTAWLGWAYVELGRIEEARALRRWIEAQVTPTGELAEQALDHLLHPEHRVEWEARWGTNACPLLWSHAMYLILEALLEKRA